VLGQGPVRHGPERLSPTLVFARPLVLEDEPAVPRNKNAMDIGPAEVQPRDQLVKRFTPQAGTFRIGGGPV
jgi:hypothetical protein